MKFRLTALMAGALALASVASAADIVDTAVAGGFTTLVAAVKAAGLVDTLQGAGPFTVFAPTDGAFAKLSAGPVESLLKPQNKARTVEGRNVSIKTADGGVMVNNARVTKADIATSNGVIHVIDTVLLPK